MHFCHFGPQYQHRPNIILVVLPCQCMFVYGFKRLSFRAMNMLICYTNHGLDGNRVSFTAIQYFRVFHQTYLSMAHQFRWVKFFILLLIFSKIPRVILFITLFLPIFKLKYEKVKKLNHVNSWICHWTKRFPFSLASIAFESKKLLLIKHY